MKTKIMLVFAVIVFAVVAVSFKGKEEIKSIKMEKKVFADGDTIEVVNNGDLGQINYGSGYFLPAISVGSRGVVLKNVDTNMNWYEFNLIMRAFNDDQDAVVIDFRAIGKGVRVLYTYNHNDIIIIN